MKTKYAMFRTKEEETLLLDIKRIAGFISKDSDEGSTILLTEPIRGIQTIDITEGIHQVIKEIEYCQR